MRKGRYAVVVQQFQLVLCFLLLCTVVLTWLVLLK